MTHRSTHKWFRMPDSTKRLVQQHANDPVQIQAYAASYAQGYARSAIYGRAINTRTGAQIGPDWTWHTYSTAGGALRALRKQTTEPVEPDRWCTLHTL